MSSSSNVNQIQVQSKSSSVPTFRVNKPRVVSLATIAAAVVVCETTKSNVTYAEGLVLKTRRGKGANQEKEKIAKYIEEEAHCTEDGMSITRFAQPRGVGVSFLQSMNARVALGQVARKEARCRVLIKKKMHVVPAVICLLAVTVVLFMGCVLIFNILSKVGCKGDTDKAVAVFVAAAVAVVSGMMALCSITICEFTCCEPGEKVAAYERQQQRNWVLLCLHCCRQDKPEDADRAALEGEEEEYIKLVEKYERALEEEGEIDGDVRKELKEDGEQYFCCFLHTDYRFYLLLVFWILVLLLGGVFLKLMIDDKFSKHMWVLGLLSTWAPTLSHLLGLN